MKRILRVFLPLVMIASSAHAIVITAPTGLAPGTQYRLAFVTSTGHDATSSDIADYNAFVTGVANTVPELLALGTTWTAIGSTAMVDARDNTGTNPSSTGFPIYLLNDTKLVDNNADLWDGNIDVFFAVSQTGLPGPLSTAFTGTNPTGQGGVGGGGVTGVGDVLGGANPIIGRVNRADGSWVASGTGGTNAGLRPMYALSAPLTMSAVPAPGAAWLFGSALAFLGAARKRHRQPATV